MRAQGSWERWLDQVIDAHARRLALPRSAVEIECDALRLFVRALDERDDGLAREAER